MTTSQIEAWAREVIERVKATQHIEDLRVEAKSTWPTEHRDAARRIAGQANAARGEPILYLVGVDEKGGRVTGAALTDLATWHAQIVKHFDSFAPPMTPHAFGIDDTTVVALQFDTDGPPFVVTTGLPGPIAREVPWREATGIRSATRGDLFRILVPTQRLPELEFIGGRVRLGPEMKLPNGGEILYRHIDLKLSFYLVPKPHQSLVIPYHRCDASVRFRADGRYQIVGWLKLSSRSPLIVAHPTSDEAVVNGAGRLEGKANIFAQASTLDPPSDSVQLRARLHVCNSELPVVISTVLQSAPDSASGETQWGDLG